MEHCRVLVIEDDEIAREQLAKVIKKEGHQVLEAEDGRVGVELFKKELPEIVVTDLKMSDADGMEVVQMVKRLSAKVQVIVTTALGETDTAVMAIREGALDYLKKPIDTDQLTVALGRAAEKVMEYKKVEVFPALLFADDEERTRERLARVLKQEGWAVFQVADGEEAVNVFKETKIDVAILDIKMPKKDGLQALHEMRRISDDFEAIILTGYGDANSAIQALRDGAMNFLKKPIDLDEMILAVQKATEKLQSDRSLKYRIRDLELATQIIGTITAGNQLLIDFRRHVPKATRDFANQLLDSMPVGLLVVNKDMTIVYMNQGVARPLGYQSEKVDEEFVKNLCKMGINDLSYESLASTFSRHFAEPIRGLETISTGQYSYITLAPMRIAWEEKQEDSVLLIIRGERG